MNERVRPPRELEPLLDRLKEEGVFETKQKGMMFGAGLGRWLHERGQELPELEKRGEGIRIEYFRSVDDDGFIDVLAVTEADALGVLANDRTDERIELFERYAYLGLSHLDVALEGGVRSPLEVLVELVEQAREGGVPGDLPGLDDVEGVIFG